MKRPSDLAGAMCARALALLALLSLPGILRAQAAADEPVTARTPREAYSQEKDSIAAERENLRFAVEDAEGEQYSFLKRIERLVNAAGTRLNGLGRVLWTNEQAYGTHTVLPASDRGFDALLDLSVNGTLSREARWSGLFRLRSDLLPTLSSNSLTVQQLRMDLNPKWFSAVIGDFEESYTPFTLWNRDAHDLVWDPTFSRRPWDIAKHERFVGEEPSFPFRGARAGTAVMWPDSPVMDRLQVSAFGHYARNSFDAATASYDGRSVLLGGASAEVSFKGGAGLRAYGLLYDMPDWSRPGGVYDYADPDTWSRSCRVGSVRPRVERRVWRRVFVGLEGEAAFSVLEADKNEPYRNTGDYAIVGGPSVRWGAGKVQFNALEVGNGYYSPLAQMRQRDDLTGAVVSMPVLSSLPTPAGFFAHYSRLDDNVFPYGLATPNRQGFGADFDLRFLRKAALKLKGSVWRVSEYIGNYVVTGDRTNVEPVDAPGGQTNPLRDFLYVNVAPRFDLAPTTGYPRDLELLLNVRMEDTKSDLFGELKGNRLAAGLRAGVLKGWWLEPAAMLSTSKGSEAMMAGGVARYPYRFDNRDSGKYAAADVDVKTTVLGLSTTVEAGPNAKFLLDASNREEKDALSGSVVRENAVSVGYEVVF
jgi:hypothetical protein